jgi:hypothetical protein
LYNKLLVLVAYDETSQNGSFTAQSHCFSSVCVQQLAANSSWHCKRSDIARLLDAPSLQTTFQDVIYTYLLPLHVSALVGHLQENIQLIAGSYCTYSASVLSVLCPIKLLFIFGKSCRCRLNVCVSCLYVDKNN